MNDAKEGIPPRDTISHNTLNTALSRQTQRGGAGETVNSRPDIIPRDLCRVGKEQESTASERRVEEILARTTEHLLTDNHTKADTECNLPERNAGWQNQGKQNRGNKEAFVDLVLADHSKQHFPERTNTKSDGIDRQEVSSPIGHVIQKARWIMTKEEPAMPICRQCAFTRGDQGVCLIANVPHTEQQRREGAGPHDNHDSL